MVSPTAREIYYTLAGELQEKARIPGVENLFRSGSPCANAYADMLDAYERLCDRLGVVDEDEDIEIIVSSLRYIEKEMAMKMFEYGMNYRAEQ